MWQPHKCGCEGAGEIVITKTKLAQQIGQICQPRGINIANDGCDPLVVPRDRAKGSAARAAGPFVARAVSPASSQISIERRPLRMADP